MNDTAPHHGADNRNHCKKSEGQTNQDEDISEQEEDDVSGMESEDAEENEVQQEKRNWKTTATGSIEDMRFMSKLEKRAHHKV